jgi:hypothetical protein
VRGDFQHLIDTLRATLTAPTSDQELHLSTRKLENDPLRRALEDIVQDFETDYVLDGVIVDEPVGTLRRAYATAKAALATQPAAVESSDANPEPPWMKRPCGCVGECRGHAGAQITAVPNEDKCEGCGEVSDDLKADDGDNVLCPQCRNLPDDEPAAPPASQDAVVEKMRYAYAMNNPTTGSVADRGAMTAAYRVAIEERDRQWETAMRHEWEVAFKSSYHFELEQIIANCKAALSAQGVRE